MHSVSEENYIKAIYHLQKGKDLVATNDIAARMDTKASSVTDMLKKLADKNLAQYVPYKGSRLTEDGFKCAIQIIRKHRLWELFLVEKLNFNWDEVHEIAEQLEHIQSQKLINQLDAHLGFPKHDPHGDPIPDSNGVMEHREQIPLSQLALNKNSRLTGIRDSSTEFLQYLDKHHIKLGSVLKVVDREVFDLSCSLMADDKELHISKQIADKLLVKTEG